MADKKFEEMNWAERVQDLYGQITNRPAFQYDPNSDPMYQTVKDQYVRQGQRAMEDTMGQAAALTGGYNNSYAQSAGQQQYNDQMTKLSAQIPVLAQQARAAYDAEGDRLRDQANWAQQQRAYQDDMDYRNWQMQQETQNRAYQMVMQMIGTGQVPSSELLASAGVSADYARSMANYYSQQAALAAGGGGGSGRSGGSGGSGRGSTGGGGPQAYQPTSPGTQPQAQVIKPAQREKLLQYAITHDKADFDAYFQENFGSMKNATEVYNYIEDYIINKWGNGPKGGGGGKNLIAVQ